MGLTRLCLKNPAALAVVVAAILFGGAFSLFELPIQLFPSGDNTYVFKIDSEEVAQRVNVQIGAASGKYIEVVGQLKAGDRVVVRGGERLRMGQKVSASVTS